MKRRRSRNEEVKVVRRHSTRRKYQEEHSTEIHGRVPGLITRNLPSISTFGELDAARHQTTGKAVV
jgi:hypothetical protein